MEKYLINPNQKISRIHKDIYGCFSEHLGRCIYEGTFVGEDSPIPNVKGMRTDVVGALRDMGIPALRWPGGCFADEYHWKDGIGAPKNRKKMINTHWGGVVEDNSFGTHEFFELCDQLGCDPYICGNVGSGTVQEMSEWVEYITSGADSPMPNLRRENGRDAPWRLPFFGVGNENWGCGGNMTAEFYADQYRRYATYIRSYGDVPRPYRIAGGANAFDYHWTEVLMQKATPYMDGLSLHYYSWANQKTALDFDDDGYYDVICKAFRMDELITRHGEIMNRYDPAKRIGLIVDEWGTWYKVEEGTNPGFLYQQNSMRDAMVAALTLNIFNKHSDRVRMANIAQTVNVLQSVALTDGEDMVLTPTYHAFKMYKDHQNRTLLGSYITTPHIGDGYLPMLQESASVAEDGTIVSTVLNTSLTESAEITCQVADTCVTSVTAEILSGDPHDHNDFHHKDTVGIKPFTDLTPTADGFTATLPPCSVVKFTVR